jgi:hypothetical protein
MLMLGWASTWVLRIALRVRPCGRRNAGTRRIDALAMGGCMAETRRMRLNAAIAESYTRER